MKVSGIFLSSVQINNKIVTFSLMHWNLTLNATKMSWMLWKFLETKYYVNISHIYLHAYASIKIWFVIDSNHFEHCVNKQAINFYNIAHGDYRLSIIS